MRGHYRPRPDVETPRKYMEYRIQFALDTWDDGLGIELLRRFRMFSLECLDVNLKTNMEALYPVSILGKSDTAVLTAMVGNTVAAQGGRSCESSRTNELT